MTLRRRILSLLILATAACGDDDRATSDAGPTPDATLDAARDTVPPFVTGTDPADDAIRVGSDRAIEVFFSEPMAEVGTASARADDAAITLVATWSDDARALRLTGTLPAAATVEVELEGFEDLVGNPLTPFTFSFETADVDRPHITSASPEEGAEVAELAFDARFDVDEALASDRGAAALVGGPGEVGTIRFDGTTLVVPVSGLAVDTAYSLVLSGFADGSGNTLDGTEVLGDEALDFTTAPDTVAPRVVDAMPGEGTVDVPVGTQLATFLFDEPMAAVGTVTLGDAALPTSWVTPTRLTVRLPAPLALSTAYSLVLSGFEDLAGNALDEVAYLVDGALDFTAGDDLFAPYVVGSLPEEGAVDVPYDVPRIVVAFSEAMDTSVSEVSITSALGSATVAGTWSESGTLLEIDVTSIVVAGQTYRVSFPGFSDARGSALDLAHPYLEDGVLDFTTVAPTGERCRDALDVARATSSSGAMHEWVLPAATFTSADGPMTCDTSTSNDAVIRVPKLGDATSLRVTVESANTDELVVQATRAVCDTTTEAGVAAIARCLPNSNQWAFHLEGDAGDYFLWVAHENSGAFDGATVRVEEIAPPEGESCTSPLGVTSTSFYTAPTAAGEFHTWTVPTDGIVGYDRGGVNGDADDFVCNTDTERGADFVVQWDKTSATSVVEIEVSIGTENGLVELLDGACLPSGGATSTACEPGFTGSRTYLVDGPARPLFVWVAADDDGLTSDPFSSYFPPSATVRAREIEPGPGDSCASAIPITIGANAVTPTGTRSLGAPTCTATAVTWYRFTATTSLSVVSGNGFASSGIVSPSDGELACGSVNEGVAAFTVVGDEYCVAVSSGAAVTSLVVDAIDYPGVTGRTVTDLAVTPYAGSSASDNVFDPEDWMAVTPTYVYLASDSDRLMRAPRTGGVEAEALLEDATVMGEAGVAVGEAIFGVDDSRSAPNRLFRYVDATGTFAVTPWDTGSAWVNAGIDAIAYDGTSLLLASSSEVSSPEPITFYSADPNVAGPVTLLGTNDSLSDVSAMVADATYLYVVGTVGGTEGVYRLARGELGNPAATVEELPVAGASFNHSNDNAGLALQPAVGGVPGVLYFRVYNPADVFAILAPESATPRFLGRVFDLGQVNDDYVLALDPTTPALFLTEEETDLSDPRWLRVE